MSLTTNTIFALLMALEEDVRRACVAEIPADASPLTSDETLSATARFRVDHSGASDEPRWQTLLDYVDLSQLLDVVSRQKDILATAVGSRATDISNLVREVRRLVPTRNRVCHARPPEPDDLSLVLEITEGLVRGSPSRVSFTALMDVLTELRERSLPLGLDHPCLLAARCARGRQQPARTRVFRHRVRGANERS